MRGYDGVGSLREVVSSLSKYDSTISGIELFTCLNDFILSGEYLTCGEDLLFRNAIVLPDLLRVEDLESRPRDGAGSQAPFIGVLRRIADGLLHIQMVSESCMEYDNEHRIYEVNPYDTINHTLDTLYARHPLYCSVKEWLEVSVPLVMFGWQLHTGEESLRALLKLYSRLSSEGKRQISEAADEYMRLRSVCAFLLYKWFERKERKVYGGYLLYEQDR